MCCVSNHIHHYRNHALPHRHGPAPLPCHALFSPSPPPAFTSTAVTAPPPAQLPIPFPTQPLFTSPSPHQHSHPSHHTVLPKLLFACDRDLVPFVAPKLGSSPALRFQDTCACVWRVLFAGTTAGRGGTEVAGYGGNRRLQLLKCKRGSQRSCPECAQD